MKLIVGLGNPGIEYQFTLHNLGFLAVDRIAELAGVQVINRHCKAQTGKAVIGGKQVVLAKPETYMNLSGLSVAELVREYGVFPEQDLIVINDELDLPFGSIRVRQRGGSAGHNGMESVIGALASEDFIRVRLGIAPERKLEDGARYVLSQIRKAQLEAVDSMLDAAAEAVKVIVMEGVAAAMNRFNRRPEAESPAD